MTVIDKAVEWAVGIANDPKHGYSQANRWGADYDCSSLVISAWEQAGVPVKTHGATYTGNMLPVFKSCGFKPVTDGTRKRGDVLLCHNGSFQHTALMISADTLVQASQSENGGIYGVEGDQTGREINISPYYTPRLGWDYVLRYSPAVDCSSVPDETPNEYVVQGGDTLYQIAERFGVSVYDLAALNGIKDPNLIYKGAVLRLYPEEVTECEDCVVTIPEENMEALNNWDVGLGEMTPNSDDYYVVQAGDTLSGIAFLKYGRWSYYEQIKKANGLTSDTILVGQKLHLPPMREFIK